MNFYRGRPLALAISIGILAAAAAALLTGMLRLLPAILALIAAPVLAAVLRRYDIHTICGTGTRTMLILTAVIILVLTAAFFAYFELYAAPYDIAREAEVHGTVVRVKSAYSYCSTYVVRLDTLDGEAVHVLGLLYAEDAAGMSPGDTFRAKAAFTPRGDFYTYYDISGSEVLSWGYIFTGEIVGKAEITGESRSLEVRLHRLRDRLGALMGLYLPEEHAALANALLLGDRSGLTKIRRDFRYAGVSHLLAVSGLHLSVLCGGFLRISEKILVPYRLRHGLAILFILLYMTLTGFPVSVVRSGIMLIFAYIAAIIDRDYDALTALFIAAGLILLIDPASVFDKAFALSVTATLGVVLVSADAVRLARRVIGHGRKKRRQRRFLVSCCVAVGAAMFVMPLQWLYFGETSVLAVPATLLLGFFVELLLLLIAPFFLLALLGCHFWCGRLGWIISLFSEFVSVLAGWMAELSPLVSLRYPFVPVIMLLAVSAIVWMIVTDRGSWVHALIPFAAGSLLFFACVGIYNIRTADRAGLRYVYYNRNEAFVLSTGSKSMLIDASLGSRPTMSYACTALKEDYHTEFDALLLTHLHPRHRNAVKALFDERVVRRIYIPKPVDGDEEAIVRRLLALMPGYHVEAYIYDRQTELTVPFGNVTLELPAYAEIKRSVHPMLAVNFVTDYTRYSWVGNAAWESPYIWDFVKDADRLLLGLHGAVYKTPPESLPDGCMPEAAGSHPLTLDMPILYTYSNHPFPRILLHP